MRHDTQTVLDACQLARYIAAVGHDWTRPEPGGMRNLDLRDRLDSAIGSALTQMEGGGGVEPHRLSPIGAPDVNLLDDNDDRTPERAQFIAIINRLVDAHTRRRAADLDDAVFEVLLGLCERIAEQYELRAATVDGETGVVDGYGDDMALLLPDAFAKAW